MREEEKVSNSVVQTPEVKSSTVIDVMMGRNSERNKLQRVGKLCVAFSNVRDTYLRAVMMYFDQKDVVVRYLDYGILDTLKSDELWSVEGLVS